MSSRLAMAYAAIAALALMISGAAHALTFCDIYPNRCQYTPSGKGYYYPHGYRLPSEMPGFGAGSAASTQVWGCLATGGAGRGRSWGYPNRLSASYSALSACAKRGTGCRIISCNPSVHSNYESYAAFHNMHR